MYWRLANQIATHRNPLIRFALSEQSAPASDRKFFHLDRTRLEFRGLGERIKGCGRQQINPRFLVEMEGAEDPPPG